MPPSIEELARENDALRRALGLLRDLANLAQNAEDPEAAAYAVLTGITAGVGLGLNRAMIFVPDTRDPGVLVGMAAIGPIDRDEADRVWRSIEAEAPDLETLYEAGLRQRDTPSALDRRVRATRVDVRGAGQSSPIALALERPVRAEGDDVPAGLLHLPTSIGAPMRARDGRRGVLLADNAFTGEVPDPATRLVLELVADHAGRALESAARFARVAREARTCSLTGLDTRRVGLEVLEHALARARSGGPPIGLALIDLDDFKRLNDVHGHPVGDAALAAVGERLRAIAGRGRRAFRYGGEELGVIVEAGDADATLEVAHEIHRQIRGIRVRSPGGDPLAITCSIGVASARDGDPGALIRAADEALLRAKSAGKDRVEAS